MIAAIFASMEEERTRTKLRGKVTKLTNDLRDYRQSKEVDQDDLAYKIHVLETQLTELRLVQTELDKTGIRDETNHDDLASEEIFKAKRLLVRVETEGHANAATSAQSNVSRLKVSDVKLPVFSGDLLQWSEFWDLFEVAVHTNSRYATVQKYVILKSHLSGLALQCIKGIPVSEACYSSAVEALKDRFCKTERVKEEIMKQLLSMPRVSEDLPAMRSFVDHLTSHVRTLGALGVSCDSLSSLLLPIAKGKLPEAWRLEWARQHQPSAGLKDFIDFLRKEMDIREEANVGTKLPSPQERTPLPTVSALSVSSSQQQALSKGTTWTCMACKKFKHGLSKCFAYQKMTVDERWAVVKKAGLCFQCLGPHHVRQCKSKPCTVCGATHHTSLHTAPPAAAVQSASVPASFASVQRAPEMPARQPNSPLTPQTGYRWQHCSAAVNANCVGDGSDQMCYNQTVLVDAVGPEGVTKQVRVMIDGGSDSSFIRAAVAEELGLETLGQGTFACIGFQEHVEEARTYDQTEVMLNSRHTGEGVKLKFWKSDRLCVPVHDRKPDVLSLPSGIQLADTYQGGPVDMLIGLDQMYHVVLWNHIEVSPALRLIETVFGYVLHGQAPGQQQSTRRHIYRCHTVEEMWTLDAVGVTEDEVSTSVSKRDVPTWNDVEERYEMALLWKSDRRPTSNIVVAESRTRRMTEKLAPEQFDEYNSNLVDMMENSVIEDAPSPQDPSVGFYLPHHGVYRNRKLRVVYDGSAADGDGHSLNSYLESGENLLSRIPAVLLNFRAGSVACQTDIRAAFHQVVVPPEDRIYLQFLWLDRVLRFQRVPFGLTCAPFMLLRTVDTHLLRYESADPDLCQKVRSGMYMDDICMVFSTREEACRGMEKTRQMFEEASMSLHKTRVTGDEADDTSVLGLMWSTMLDELAVIVPELSCPTTKRALLSTVSKVFDPLGVLTPWLVKGKCLFQKTWKLMPAGQWEEKLPRDLQEEVRVWWSTSAHQLVRFPRPFVTSAPQEVVYHVFCDASAVAFCSVVYAVQGGEARIVVARSRLAPLATPLTIPRLELLAALVGTRLMVFVQKALNLTSPTVFFWTDSMDVIYWISCQKPRKVFVENRVAAILQSSRVDQWRHVRGEDNPADLGTRGLSLASLTSCVTWWQGPKFILNGVESVNMSPVPVEPGDSARQEMKPIKAARRIEACGVRQQPEQQAGQSPNPDVGHQLFAVTDCSSLKQAVNRYAWVLRFVTNVRRQRSERETCPQLTPEERKHALRQLIGEAQRRHFASELTALNNNRPLPVKSPLTKLHPQIGPDGILESIPRTNEQPIVILPEFAHVTTLIIDEGHRRCFHQGVRVTLAVISTEYAVRRRMVQRVVSTCYRCRRYRGLAYRSAEGPLPSYRSEYCRPFDKVGIDYFGPMYVDTTDKVWALLITCATSRAVHIELVRSQSSADLALALRRFFAIRGTPALIVSDNAKTFRALLNQIPRSVMWRYIPEAAPWWGGWWERLVGLTKKAMRITLHQTHLTFAELSVVLYELSFCLNLRPLTVGDGENLLTPAHLLFGVKSLTGVLSPTVCKPDGPDRVWRRRCRVSDHLQRRWQKEYLQALRGWRVSARRQPVREPDVGEVVLVHGEGPRSRWPLARVLELIRGPDGNCRAAFILMRGIRTRRPISKIFRLEASPEGGTVPHGDDARG